MYHLLTSHSKARAGLRIAYKAHALLVANAIRKASERDLREANTQTKANSRLRRFSDAPSRTKLRFGLQSKLSRSEVKRRARHGSITVGDAPLACIALAMHQRGAFSASDALAKNSCRPLSIGH